MEYQGQTCKLPLIVVKGKGPTLLGRNWFSKIRLNWHSIYYNQQADVSPLLDKYSEVFEDSLGTFRDYEAHLDIDS